jgi:YjbE family integral membrane protein
MIDAAASLFLLLQIFFVDLLLGADNAVVIAMACGRLPPEDARRAMVLGAGGAIALRLIMILFANALLGVPLVKLVGAWMLIVIALNVRAKNAADGAKAIAGGVEPNEFVSAAAVIMFADAAMSLDNVVALAAIAGGNFWLMAIGVLISIPMIVYGAFILTRMLRLAPEIFTIGAAFLGWIAGAMATTDPLVSGFIDVNAPALAVFGPALAALFVLAAGSDAAPSPKRPARSPAVARAPLRAAIAGSACSVKLDEAALRVASQAPAPVRAESRQSAVSPSPPDDVAPGFAPEEPRAASPADWSEERLVVAGLVLLAFLAGLIIFIASFFDSLT